MHLNKQNLISSKRSDTFKCHPSQKGRLKPIFRRPFATLQNKSSRYPLPKRRLKQ